MASSTIQRSAFTGQTALKQSNELLRKVGIFANGRVSMRRTVKSAPQHIWLFWLSKRDEVYSIKVGLTKGEPPPANWVKVNFNGTVFQECGKAGLGTIICNDVGLVMTALTQIIRNSSYSAACFGHILSDIKTLSPHFRELVFRHTHRQGNKVSHNLAWAAFSHFNLSA
ncbi:chlorophyll a-b binding protein 2.1 [Quercus suber]|uniref:Chlorophyll a-b binding protein 2.1 n=1 Tax=Quercus suber TaxID=58331 RepID=A0AAW0J1R8_QUESU